MLGHMEMKAKANAQLHQLLLAEEDRATKYFVTFRADQVIGELAKRFPHSLHFALFKDYDRAELRDEKPDTQQFYTMTSRESLISFRSLQASLFRIDETESLEESKQEENDEETISNYIGGDLTHVNDFCKTILESIEVSSILKLPEALHDPLMTKSQQISLKRVDNIVNRKVAILLCNEDYKGVKDPEGFQIGSVFEAKHKTELMESFLQKTLKFDSVSTLHDQDMDGINTMFIKLQKEEVHTCSRGLI